MSKADRIRYLGPTPERLAKAGESVEPVESDTGFTTLRLTDKSPLDDLANKGRKSPEKGITGEQYYAGCRYYEDAFKSGILGQGVIDLEQERVDGGEFKGVSESRLDAMTRYNKALRSLDRASKHILSDVVLSDVPLNVYADRFREFKQPRERRAIALQRLRDALDQLGEFYYPPRRNRSVSSHLADYRPIIIEDGEEATA